MYEKNEEKNTIPLGDWYRYFALEIELVSDDSFLLIKETLERIGVSSNKDKKLYQSCHIFTKKKKYYIVHFKELFALDGRTVDITEDDIGRRNTIACLLEEWNLLKIVDKKMVDKRIPVTSMKILQHSQCKKNGGEYDLIPKYQIGTKKGNHNE